MIFVGLVTCVVIMYILYRYGTHINMHTYPYTCYCYNKNMKPYKLVFCLVEDQTDWETSMTGYTKQQNIMYMSRTWNNTSHWSLSDQILTEEIKFEFTHIPNGSQWEWRPIVNPFVFQAVYVRHTPCMYYNYNCTY